jgi:hypothetical protein
METMGLRESPLHQQEIVGSVKSSFLLALLGEMEVWFCIFSVGRWRDGIHTNRGVDLLLVDV